MRRGNLTDEAKEKWMKLLKEELTIRKLRLLPYLHHVLVDGGGWLDPVKMNDEEQKILTDWRLKRFIGGEKNKLVMTKKFWDAISELIWLTYANIER